MAITSFEIQTFPLIDFIEIGFFNKLGSSLNMLQNAHNKIVNFEQQNLSGYK